MRAAEIVERLSVPWQHGEHVDLAGIACEGRLDLSGRDLPGVDLSGATFPDGLDATGARFQGLAWFRGIAFNATGRPADAAAELRQLESLIGSVPPERTVAFFFRARNVLRLAANVLAGEMAATAGDIASAERLLRAAVAEQDTHWFSEPPPWYFPVRQSLGAVLLRAGRAADAERVYREDLQRNPGNGWSLFGLAESLRAQGKTADAAQAEARFRKAWATADVRLTASRF